MLQEISLKKRERERESSLGHGDTGTEALLEKRCFIQHCVGIYTVLQDSYFQQRYYHNEGTYHHIEKLKKEIAWIPQPGERLASPFNS